MLYVCLYDIRGIVDKDLNEQIAELIGRGFGTYLRDRGAKDVVVGHDSRASSPVYKEAVIKGLKSTGCTVHDSGMTLTSMVYFARKFFNIEGGLMITASHNPPQYNGFKLCHGVNSISGEEIQKVKDIIVSGKFRKGNGEVKKLDIVSPYFTEIKKRVKVNKKLKIVVDAGNGTAGAFVPEFLKSLGFEVVPLFCDLDPRYPNHIPDPVGMEYYKELIKKVKGTGADLGLMFDGDGDRVGFVDEKGNIHLGDTILGLLIRDIVKPKDKVIVELKDSEMVVEETKRLGGTPIFWKTGHALLDDKVYEEKAVLCGEMSCHYWVVDNWYCFDDAIYAMARTLQIITNSGKPLSALVAGLPKYESTPEYRVACLEEKKFQVVSEVSEYFKGVCRDYIDLDGIRGYVNDGWFLIRASNTQPIISVRCEAKTKKGLENIKALVQNRINKYSFVNLDWNRQYDNV